MEATNDEVVEALDVAEGEEEEALIKAEVEDGLTEELIRLAEDEIKRELELELPVVDAGGVEVDTGVEVVEGDASMTWTVVVEVGAGAACSAAKATGAKAAEATRRALVKCIFDKIFCFFVC